MKTLKLTSAQLAAALPRIQDSATLEELNGVEGEAASDILLCLTT